MKQNILTSILFLSILFLFAGCEEEKTADVVTISGKVVTENNVGIEQVQVTLGKLQTYTDAEGIFLFEEIPLPETNIIGFAKEGFLSQSFAIDLKPGKKVLLDVQLKAPSNQYSIKFTRKSIHFPIYERSDYVGYSANTDVEVSTNADWVGLYLDNYWRSVTVFCQVNNTPEPRSALVILQSKNGAVKDTLIVTQDEGPVLNVINYTGKNNAASTLGDIPFIKFNRRVVLQSIDNGVKTSNLIYEEDSTVIRFPDIRTALLNPIDYYYKVKSRDGQTFSDKFSVIPPNRIRSYYTQNILFTKDSRYCWLIATDEQQGGYKMTQVEISTSSIVHSINIGQNVAKACYNPYNNCIYLYNTFIRIYNADTGALTAQLSLPEALYGNTLESMDFCNNGLGLMNTRQHLYTIDAAHSHRMEPYTCSKDLHNGYNLPPEDLRFNNILAGNNRKQFVLYRKEYITEVATIEAASKQYRICYTESNPWWDDCRIHKREPYIWLSVWMRDQLLSININTGEATTYPSRHGSYTSYLNYPLAVEATIPWKGFVYINEYRVTGVRRDTKAEYLWLPIGSSIIQHSYSSDDGAWIAIADYNYAVIAKASELEPE